MPLLAVPTPAPQLAHRDDAGPDDRIHGTVLWFDSAKGFGFLASDDQPGRNIFVEHSCIDQPGYRTLSEGQAVLFTFERDARGARATWVLPR